MTFGTFIFLLATVHLLVGIVGAWMHSLRCITVLASVNGVYLIAFIISGSVSVCIALAFLFAISVLYADILNRALSYSEDQYVV